MRLTFRRLLLALGIVATTSVLPLIASATPAHADTTCYTVQVGNIEGVTVCPWG
jgi:hypothetical protein